MSANCKFSKKYLPLVKQKRNTLTEGDFDAWMQNTFLGMNTETLNEVKGILSQKRVPSSSETKEIKVPSMARAIISSAEDNPSIDSLYIGRSDLRLQMEQRFAEDIVALTVFNRHENDGKGQWVNFNAGGSFGLNQGNEKIWRYKCGLIDILYNEMRESGFVTDDPEYPHPEDSALEYDAKIQRALRTYRDFLSSHEDGGKAYTEFAILQNFDKLIETKAPFILFNRQLNYDFADKYEYKGPNVEHYTGFTSSEFASIENQESNLAKILLSVLPEVDNEGKAIKGSFIGLSGFNSAMTSLKKAILYSTGIFSNEAKSTYYNGLSIDLNTLIDEYVSKLSNPSIKMDDEHRTFLLSKLRGIQKYIYNEDLDPIIKNMFTQMFFKTEAVSYRAYTFDNDSETFKGKNLRSTIVNTQRYQLEDAIRGAVYLLQNNPERAEKLRSKYNIIVDDSGIHLSSLRDTMHIEVTQVNQNGERQFVINQRTNAFTKDFINNLISDVLGIIMPDTYEQVGVQLSGNTFKIIDDFKMPIGVTLLAAFGPRTATTYKNGLINLKPYIKTLAEPAKKFSVIYGSETRNVIKSPSGNNLPTYQLTNMSYNVQSLIDDCRNFVQKHEWDQDPYESNVLVRIKGLLTAPQIRNEIRVGDKTKNPSQLSVKELLHVSVLYDFYEQLNAEDIIYLQNATFADKNTHFLIGYNIATKIDGVSLQDLLKGTTKQKGVLQGGSSKPILDMARASREERITRIVNNVLNDYKKVCLISDNAGHQILNPKKFRCLVDGFGFNTLEQLDKFLQYGQILVEENGISVWKNLTIDLLTDAFVASDVQFDEEIHGYAPKNDSLGKVRVNETMMSFYNTFRNNNLWTQRINSARRRFIQNIQENKWKWNRYDSGTMRKIWDKYKQILGSEWFNENSGDMKLFVGETLHPILEAYFVTDLFLSNEYNDLTIGEVFAHPNKNKKLSNINNISAASIYQNLGSKTKSPRVVITEWKNLKDFSSPFDNNGNVISTRLNGNHIESFGNTFTSDQRLMRPGMTKVNSTREAVEKYINAVLTSNDPHYRWIREQCQSGNLKGRTIFYYSELGEPSHATALDYLINDFDWNSINSEFDPTKEEGTYEEFSEANRLIAQIKRSVAFGATYHPFAQNQLNGVTDVIDIAVMSDMKAFPFTPNGEEDKVDSMDGSGLSDALQARFESNSLLDARVGHNKKTIMMDVDRRTGKPILLKWAVYALTNAYRCDAFASNAPAELLVRKMRSKAIRILDNIADYYNERDEKIIYKDYNYNQRYKILEVGYTPNNDMAYPNSWFRKVIRVRENGEEFGDVITQFDFEFAPNVAKNTLYALDQLFGGAWTCEYNPETGWKGNEASQDMLEYILSKKENQDLKRGFIAYAVNKSAIKVGAGNVNRSDAFKDGNELHTIQMRTKYGGVQMDADQELDLEEVTEMTQMISSLIENSHYSDLVNEIYSDLGRVVARHMMKYAVNIDKIFDINISPEEKEKAKKDLYQILGESLVVAFSSGSKDTLGLAQAFIKKATEAIRQRKEFKLPFSAATINGAFISDVAASINRGGIRHKYDGLSGVLNPSFNMIQYYRVYNERTGKFEHRMFEQLADKMNEYGIHDINAIQNSAVINGSINPFIISQIQDENGNLRNLTVNDIDFEDTIYITDHTTGKTQEWYINTFDKYDEVKTILRSNPDNYTIRLNTARGRNLRGADTRFVVNGIEYSYYDLDSVKASFYLNRLVKGKGKFGRDILKSWQTQFLKDRGYDIDENAKITKDDIPVILSWLKNEQTNTQRTLRNIELGRTFKLFGNNVTASSWRTRAPEIIMGRYQMNKFGIGHNDHIYQIQDASFFTSKLESRYSIADSTSLPENLYDIVLYEGDKKFYVKIGDDASINSMFTQVGGLRHNSEFVINGNSIWYNDEELTTVDGKRFKTFTNQNGEQFNVIVVDNIDRYQELMDSGIFDRRIQSYNYTEQNKELLKQIQFGENTNNTYRLYSEFGDEIRRITSINPSVQLLQENADLRKRIAINNKAKDMFDSFKRSLLYVGARIPTQAMQSFMPMEVVAFIDSDYNQLYVPVMQTYLEGSDYDIDKLYVMAFSVDSNGFVSTGSKLQDYFSLGVVSNVVSPNGVTYEEGINGVSINHNQLNTILNAVDSPDNYNDTEIINILNFIYNSGTNEINFTTPALTQEELEQFEKDKRIFLKIINSHSQSPRDVRGNSLKNRIVSAIYNVTTKAQNQLIAQVPINMDEQHDAANNSTLGRAEMHINSDDPSTKYMMQVQNMIGKQVIGISAVALKGFFGMTFVYSRYVQDLEESLEQNDSNDALLKLRRLLLVNPMSGEVTSIANLNLENLLEQMQADDTKRIITVDSKLIGNDAIASFIKEYKLGELEINGTNLSQINLYGLLSELNKRVNKVDAALTLSGIISAATDNAKELILAKINATPELVDIYTYLTAIGVPFKDIAEFMTSKEIQFVSKLGESDIFDASSNAYNVKDAITFATGETLLKGIQRDVISTYLSLNGDTGSPYMSNENLIKNLLDSEKVRKTIEKLNSAIKNRRISDEELEQIEARYYSMLDEGQISESSRNVRLEPFRITELRNAIKFLELVLERNQYLHDPTIQTLSRLLKPVKELSTFGRFLGINQGQPTKLHKLKSMKESVRNWIDEGFDKVMDFDLDKFITDAQYRADWINQYAENKFTFNILEAFTILPHFWEMIKTLHYSEAMIRFYSVKSRASLDLMEELSKNAEARQNAKERNKKDPGRLRLSEKEFRSIDDYINELIIARFLRESQFEVYISPEAVIKMSDESTPIHPIQTRKLRLDSKLGLENFKLWMDTYVIPRIIETHKGNSFVDQLRPLASEDEKTHKKITGWKLPLQMLEIDKSPNTIQIYGEILTGFNEIAGQDAGEFGQNIGDLFYVYNMIVNKDSFGQNSFTRIFENLIQTDGANMANLFNAYISRLDESDLNYTDLGATKSEAAYRIAKDNPDTRVPTNASLVNTVVETPLDLPMFYQMPIKNVLTEEEVARQKIKMLKPAYAYELDAEALTTELVKQLQQRTNADIHLITDDDLEQFKDLPQYEDICDSKGFILNGAVYINLTKSGNLSSSVFLHEFSHIILAYLKFSDKAENRALYYSILNNVKDHPAFEEIARRYPHHVGSDLYEEVFANLLEEFFAGKEYVDDLGNTRNVSSGFMTNYKEQLVRSLNYLFDLQGKIIKAEDVINKPLEDVLSAFGYNLLNSSVEISKVVIENAQLHNTIKSQLYENEKLKNTCDET